MFGESKGQAPGPGREAYVHQAAAQLSNFFLDLQEAQITTDMESLTAEKRTKILQANKVLLVQPLNSIQQAKLSLPRFEETCLLSRGVHFIGTCSLFHQE